MKFRVVFGKKTYGFEANTRFGHATVGEVAASFASQRRIPGNLFTFAAPGHGILDRDTVFEHVISPNARLTFVPQ